MGRMTVVHSGVQLRVPGDVKHVVENSLGRYVANGARSSSSGQGRPTVGTCQHLPEHTIGK